MHVRSSLHLARRVAAFVSVVVALLTIPLVACADAETATGGRTFVVATDGSDTNSGSADAPFRTLAKVLPMLRAGDELLVRGGTYPERLRAVAIAPATASAPIVVRNWPGERPVIEGLLWLKNASHWTVDGINVTWSSANTNTEHMVKFTDGTGWTYKNAEVWDAHSFAGILVAGSASNWRITDMYVHDTHPSNDTNQDHLIYVNTTGSGGVIERSVLAGSPNGRAVKVGGADPGGATVGNVAIRYNTMYDNQGPSNVQVAWTAANVVIERNIMVKPKAGRSNVTAFELTGIGNVVRDNIGWESARVLDGGLAGLLDLGGNAMVDPQFVNAAGRDFRTQNPVAAEYGRYAGVPAATEPAPVPATDPAPAPAPAPVATPTGAGYRMVAADGGIFTFGDAPFLGSTGNMRLNKPIVGMASMPDGSGYWLVASDGGIFSFGTAQFYGSTGGRRLNKPIVGMAVAPGGTGYWLVASDGGIFAFGSAGFHGSTGGIRLNKPIVGMAPTADGGGYWLLARDGGVFAFGNAAFHGSAASRSLEAVDIASAADGAGYWIAGAAGEVHAFGSAGNFGSGRPSGASVAGIARTATGDGYWLTGTDGRVASFGAAPYLGGVTGTLNSPIVGFAGA